jgi:hypothetical protein
MLRCFEGDEKVHNTNTFFLARSMLMQKIDTIMTSIPAANDMFDCSKEEFHALGGKTDDNTSYSLIPILQYWKVRNHTLNTQIFSNKSKKIEKKDIEAFAHYVVLE